MDSLLTPTTANFYSSIVDPSLFSASASNPATAEADVFGHAFGAYNYTESEALALKRHNELQYLSTNNAFDASRYYTSPPESNDQFSQHGGTCNTSADNEHMHFFNSAQDPAHLQANTGSGQVPAGGPAYYQHGSNMQYTNHPPNPPEPQKKTRKRKRKQLTEEEKAAKHAAFLERNRLAADKCRKRKKANNQGLEDEVKVLKLRNTVLRDIKEDLMSEINGLRGAIGADGVKEMDQKRQDLELQPEDEVMPEEFDWEMSGAEDADDAAGESP